VLTPQKSGKTATNPVALPGAPIENHFLENDFPHAAETGSLGIRGYKSYFPSSSYSPPPLANLPLIVLRCRIKPLLLQIPKVHPRNCCPTWLLVEFVI
jgi:hypothetical protein